MCSLFLILQSVTPSQVFDDSIAEKWKTEAMTFPCRDVSQKMANWVIAELRWRAESFKKTGAITVYNGDVVKSDVAIPESIKKALQEKARRLEDVPEIYKDYHPGSNGKVLDLVHPSLFPLIYGTSRVLKDSLIDVDDCIKSCGMGDTLPVRDGTETKLDWKEMITGGFAWNEPPPPYGKDFQWLPCEVDISGGDAKYAISIICNQSLTLPGSRAISTICTLKSTRTCTASSRALSPELFRSGT